MNKVSLLFSLLLLSACAGGGAPPAVYDFGPPAGRLAADGRWAGVALEVQAPAWFDSPGLAYRLSYDDPLKLHAYAASRWAGAPALLLGQRLRQQLGMAGAGSRRVPCLLRVEVQEFAQRFDRPQHSLGVLQSRVSLLDERRAILAERPVLVERPAASADARGGAAALAEAGSGLGRELAAWLDGLDRSGGLKGCRAL